jgi:hypothetical protein
MFTVPPAIRDSRMKTCQECKHYRKTTMSCGTLIVGNSVPEENEFNYRKKKVRLCGCVMPVKTKLIFAKCPLNKWDSFRLSKEEIAELREFVGGLPLSSLSREQVKKLYEMKSKLTGRRENPSTCGSCVAGLIKEFKNQLDAL